MQVSDDDSMNRVRLSYLLTIIYSFFIFISIPYVRPVQKFVYHSLGKNFFTLFVLLAIFAAFTFAVVKLARRIGNRIRLGNFLWLIFITAIYAYLTVKLRKNPEEAIHFVEYGILSYLVYNALRNHIQDITIYLTGSIIVLIVGTIDEIIQWLVPVRFWQLSDVGLNFIAGFLLQILIWKGIQPEIISKKIQQRSVIIFSSVLCFSILLLGLCIYYLPLNRPASL
jgi:hypothetical protein